MKPKTKKTLSPAEASAQRGDHEVILFGGRFIPILGVANCTGGPLASDPETAANTERFLASTRKAAK